MKIKTGLIIFAVIATMISIYCLTSIMDNNDELRTQITTIQQSIADLEQQNITLGKGILTLTEQIAELQQQNQAMQEYISQSLTFPEESEEASRGSSGVRHIFATVTAYHESECNKKPSHPEYGITYSGEPVKEWFTVAAAPMFPIGTVLYIPYFKDSPNHGIFVIEDRGSAIVDKGRYGPSIDIYMSDLQAVKEFGGKKLEVYVLK